MADTDRDEIGLERLFEAARAAPEPVSEALMARVLADARTVQESRAAPPLPATPAQPGFMASLRAALGGWPAMAGLATAAAAGIWIGYSPALGLGEAMAGALGLSPAADVSGDLYLVDFATGFEFAFEEGETG